ncbi:MAG: asparagine--tRNA ligase [Deltaproteobacteria bacterium]|nr:MAG: asparagine--tRNA ligase [Deltaproteobacteria bacterium]
MVEAKRMRIIEILKRLPFGKEVSVKGWVRTKRESKQGFSFIELNDGSCFSNLQIIADGKIDDYENIIKKISTGCSLEAIGKLVESPGGKQAIEMQAFELKVVGTVDPATYPLQKKRHSFEFLRKIAHLRPKTNTFGAITRVRNFLSWSVHKFFQERGFYYLNTPIITCSDCEGAGEMFQVTTLDLEDLPRKNGAVDYSEDFFGKKANLTVSGQLEAEAYALALGNVYTFGPTFRAENSNTRRHLAEFWMVEPEMAFCDLKGNVELSEEFLKTLCGGALESCGEDMAFFEKFINSDVVKRLEKIAIDRFEVIEYGEAIKLLEPRASQFEYPVGWGHDLQAEHERYLTEKVFEKPVVIINYPKEIKPFYMKVNSDDKTVAAMDILFPQLGEVIGGSQREDNYEVLKSRIKETGLNEKDYWWYLELRKYGTAPHSGFGLGFERFVQFVTGMANIRDVIPFPRTPGNAEF